MLTGNTAKAGNESTSKQLVTVRIGQETYGIPIERVESIVRWEALTRLPRLPRFLAGLLSLRGQIIPVIDLRVRLELPAGVCGPTHRIVITCVDGLTVGWIVDAVREVVRVEQAQIETNIPLVSGGSRFGDSEAVAYFRGVANLPQGFIVLLDLECLLSLNEQTQLTRLEKQGVGCRV